MYSFSLRSWIERGYILLIFLLFMDSMYPWYMWENRLSTFTVLLTSCFSILFVGISLNKFSLTNKKIGLIICLAFMFVWHLILIGGVGSVFQFITWIVLLLLKDEFKDKLLSFITKWFAWLLLISLIFYIAFLVGFSINPTYIEYQGRYPTLNYIFFTLPIDQVDFFRFKSIFMEPGHLTMGLVPLIIANRFNLKNRYVLILFIAELFTFSLAGYITMLIGYILLNFSFQRLKYLVFGGILLVISLFVLENAGFSEMLDKFLWNRLEYHNGDIAGNNRTTAEFDMLYESVMNTSDKWTGRSGIDMLAYGGNSGYKKYIINEGLIGVLLALIVYSYQFFIYRKYEVGVLTLILLLLLFQNAYPMWFAVMSMYILGTANLKKDIHE